MGAPVVAWLSDVEGQWDKLESFCAGNPLVSLASDASGDRLEVTAGAIFVFGGDTVDRGPAGRRILRALVAARRRQPGQVVLLAGNRDLNKLRLSRELRGAPPGRTPDGLRGGPRGPLLRWIFQNTMGASQAFAHRAAELGEPGDEAVAQSYLDDLAGGGAMRDYLALAQLAFRAGSTLFLHGGVTQENFGVVPGAPRTGDADAWIAGLNRFYAAQLAAFLADDLRDPGRIPDWAPVVAYQAPQAGSRFNQASVVYARPSDQDGNPLLPAKAVTSALASAGIFRVIVGHTPSGDCPAVLRGDGLELVLSDNSYGRIERGSQLAIDSDDALLVSSACVLDDGTFGEVRFSLSRDDDASPLGRFAPATGELVKSRLASGHYLLYRSLPGFFTAQRALDEAGVAALPLEPPCRQDGPGAL